MSTNNFFPSIRTVAERTDAIPDIPDDAPPAQPIFDQERPLEEIDSLCMSCGEQGITRMMLTSIPYFREIILMSFRCEHCGAENNEIQDAGIIRDHGFSYTVKVLNKGDLNRQLIKSRFCTVTIPEYEITIPPSRAQLTTIEGLLCGMISDLSQDQPLRRHQDPTSYEKIQAILDKLKLIVPDDTDEEAVAVATSDADSGAGHEKPVPPFTVKLEDPSGNSFLEFIGSMSDAKWNMREYTRTLEDNIALGLVRPDAVEATNERVAQAGPPTKLSDWVEAPEVDEVLVFQGSCSSCGRPLDTRMKRVDIPYFKEIIIMSTNCDACGYKDNEVKTSGAISDQGKRITLKVEDIEDLSRDVLKSETCGMEIPEIELQLHSGTLGGRFTTLEGILDQIYDEISGKLFESGDSNDGNSGLHRFLAKLKQVKEVSIPFTVILDDPVANSYLQNIYAPDPDPNMKIEWYKRTKEQEDELGISDMKVEGYEGDPNLSDEEIGEGHALESVKEEPEEVAVSVRL